MFTFKRSKDKQEPIFYIDEKPVYTQFKKDDKIRIPPFRDSQTYLDSDEFRERYGLSRKDGKELKSMIQAGKVDHMVDEMKKLGIDPKVIMAQPVN